MNRIRECNGTSAGRSKNCSWLALLLAISAVALVGRAATLEDIEIDGDTVIGAAPGTDWCPNYPPSGAAFSSQIVQDPYNTPNADRVFTQGSKDTGDVSSWAWSTSKAEAKNDLEQAAATIYEDADGSKLYFMATRFANNGDANIGIWFFQNKVGMNSNGTFSGVHAIGDILLVSAFSNGGSNPQISAYRWVGGANPLEPIASGELQAAVNQNVGTIAACWPNYQAKDNAPAGEIPFASFFEGGINLSSLSADVSKCFSSFLINTRSSTSTSASLDDFVLGSFAIKPDLTLICPPQFCVGGGTASIVASVVDNNSQPTGEKPYIYTLTPPSGPNIVFGPTEDTSHSFSGFTQAGTYSVKVAGNGCESDTKTCTLIVNQPPVCLIGGPAPESVCPSSSGLVYSGPPNMDSYLWSITGNGQISGPVNGQTVAVNAGGECGETFTLTLKITKANCDQTCTKTVTVEDEIDPSLTVPTGGALGCNPGDLPTDESVKAASSSSDNCPTNPTITVTHQDSAPGCLMTRTFTVTAKDGCDNTTTKMVVYTWTSDSTAPELTVPTGSDLGCSPANLPTDESVLAQVTASDACSANPTITVTHQDSAPGCTTTRTFTVTAKDACNNTATKTIVYTWTSDSTAPELTVPAGSELGCNPANLPTDDTLKAQVLASDACSANPTVTVTHQDSAPGCAMTRTFTVTAKDACNNTATKTVVYTWTSDSTAPGLTVPTGSDLGCSPANLPTDESVKAQVTVSDACSANPTITVTHQDSAPGCTTTRTFTVTAKDACNNIATKTVVYTWTSDSTAPSLTVPTGSELGCNPADLPTDESLKALVTASDACSANPTITVTHQDSAPGCSMTRTFTVTAKDACNNTTTKTVVYTWTSDSTAPGLTVPTGSDLGCNPTLPTDESVKALVTSSDACTADPTITVTHQDSAPGCLMTRTFTVTAKDACNNTTTKTVVYTWKADTSAPSVSCPGDVLACDGIFSFEATATDGCGTATVECTRSDSKPLTEKYPLGVTTVSCVATDACGNKSDACAFEVTVPEQTQAGPLEAEFVCAGDPISFTQRPAAGEGPFTFAWTINVGGNVIALASGDPGVVIDNVSQPGSSILTINTGEFDKATLVANTTYTVTVSVTGSCGADPASIEFQLNNCDTFCSLTQGFYGNLKGKFQGTPGPDFVHALLVAGGELKVGYGTHSIRITADDNVKCLTDRLPAGGANGVIPGNPDDQTGWKICDITKNNYPQLDKKGLKFHNNLLGQTITLGLNLRIVSPTGSKLSNLDLIDGDGNPIEICIGGEYGCDCFAVSQNVAAALVQYGGTADALFELANQALGGLISGAIVNEIHAAVSAINEKFDECKEIGCAK